MKIFTKKDFVEKYNELMRNRPKGEIDELVDPDGSPISGADTGYNDVEIRVAPHQTTDNFVATGRQRLPYFGYYGTAYSHGMHISEDEISEAKISEAKMTDLIEKFLHGKDSGKDLVPKTKKSFKDMIEDALTKYSDDKDTEIYKYLIKVKENL